jgi:hypothetical protein
VGSRPVVDWPPLLGGEEVGPSSACSFTDTNTHRWISFQS